MVALCGSNGNSDCYLSCISVNLWKHTIAMNRKIEFVRETKADGTTWYFTRKNNEIVFGSGSWTEEEGRRNFMKILETPDLKIGEEVLESIEITNI